MTPETYLKIGIASLALFAVCQLLWLGSREDKELYASFGFLLLGIASLFAWFLRLVS